MTSYDIYYRLGRIESNIDYLKQGQQRLVNEIKDVRNEIKDVRNELRTEIRELGSFVQQLAELHIKTDTKLDMTLAGGGIILAALTFAVTWRAWRDSKEQSNSNRQPVNNFFFSSFRRYKK